MSKKSSELKEQKAVLIEKMKALHQKAESEDRNFSDAEQSKYNELKKQVTDISARIERALEIETDELRLVAENGKVISGTPKPKGEWRTAKNEPVEFRNKKNDVRFSARLEKENQNLSLARAIRAMILGDPGLAPNETRAMSTSGASSAVPDSVAAQIIDYAFEQSAVMQAGASTILMPTKTMTVARINDSGLMEVKTENELFTGDDIGIDGVDLSAFTIGNVFTMSRELAQDAPNFEQIVTRTISNLLADALDNYALNGVGTSEPKGVLATSGIGHVETYGVLDGWGAALEPWALVAEAGHTPNALLMNPATVARLDSISMASLQERPEVLRNIARYHTNKLTKTGGMGEDESTLLIGDFSNLVFGIRAGAQVEISATEGDAFKKHQVSIKITWRGDVGVLQPSSFAKVTGILLTEAE